MAPRVMSMSHREALEFRLLGPVEVIEQATPLPLGPLKKHLMLAACLIEPRSILSRGSAMKMRTQSFQQMKALVWSGVGTTPHA